MIYNLIKPHKLGIDLSGLANDYAVQRVREFHDTSALIEHLRGHGAIHSAMREVIADLLEGHLKAKPRSPAWQRFRRSSVRDAIQEHANLLMGHLPDNELATLENYDTCILDAATVGFFPPFTKRRATAAARALLCRGWGITLSQLDEFIYVRKAREKRTGIID